MKVSSDMIKETYEEAEKVWVPEMVKLMKETKEPFINVIYDCDLLEQIVWDNVVLVGEAAHPITPHSSRITNMAILDAAVLGNSLEKRGAENLHSELGEFQSIWLPVVSQQVLHSLYVGRIKQGLVLSDSKARGMPNTSAEKHALPWRCSFKITLDNMFHLL